MYFLIRFERGEVGFRLAPVHQLLAFRFAQCVGSGPLSKIHQFVKVALFANGISHHK